MGMQVLNAVVELERGPLFEAGVPVAHIIRTEQLAGEACYILDTFLLDNTMAIATPLLAPLIALAVWTALIWAWMYATRIPAIVKMGMVLDSDSPAGEQMATLPPRVRWKADNYNHLMEQPTLFYAIVLSLAMLGDQSTVSVAVAWVYVGLRIVHSLVQVLVNHIMTRFALFFVGSLALFALVARAAQLAIGRA
jgi:hypothetical protein